eukprot:gene603-652_t
MTIFWAGWFVLLCLSVSFPFLYSYNGVDLSVSTTIDDWKCLTREKNVSFTIIRLYRSVGAVDSNAPLTIRLADQVGLKDIGVYMFPCLSSSNYSLSHGIVCPSVKEQVQNSLDLLYHHGITFQGQPPASTSSTTRTSSSSSSSQSSAIIELNRWWLDIEDEVPSKYYDSNPLVNQNFISSIISELTMRKIPVGIYTTKTYWQNIMDNVMGYGSQYPLWYPRYDNVDSMEFFQPFADWTSCAIKQTAGDVGFCGISQVDSDYAQD